jgi:hypothetical protein
MLVGQRVPVAQQTKKRGAKKWSPKPEPKPEKESHLHGNYGSLFSLWDRMFGTYLDPDTTKVRKFGLGNEKRDPALLMIGI